MDSIERKSPVNKGENRNKYLKTLRYTPKFSVIDAVEPIRPVLNQLSDPKPAFMYDIDVLNAHADQMQKAFNKLQARKNRLRDLVKSFQDDADGFLGQIRFLIKQFNQTTASILSFDRAFQTRHSEVLRDLLARQQFNLEKMGIRIVGINQLEFDGVFFKKAVTNRPDFFEVVFLPGLTIFDRAFVLISGIRIPSESHSNRNKPQEVVPVPTSRINEKV